MSHYRLNLSHNFLITLLPCNSENNFHITNPYFYQKLIIKKKQQQHLLTPSPQLHHQSQCWSSISPKPLMRPCSLSQAQPFATSLPPTILPIIQTSKTIKQKHQYNSQEHVKQSFFFFKKKNYKFFYQRVEKWDLRWRTSHPHPVTKALATHTSSPLQNSLPGKLHGYIEYCNCIQVLHFRLNSNKPRRSRKQEICKEYVTYLLAA